MYSKPNPLLAIEYPVLMQFPPLGPQAEIDPEITALGERMRDRLKEQFAGSLYDRTPTGEPLRVAIPAAPENYGRISFILDYPEPQPIASLREVIENSHAQLADYRQRYQRNLGYLPRTRLATQSSLPTFAAGTVKPFTPEAEPAKAAAWEFLEANTAFLGIKPTAGTPLSQILQPPRALEQTVGIAAEARGSSLVHVRYQQWHQAQPVYGGRVIMHMAKSDGATDGARPAAVTSSYSPVPPERKFEQKIDATRAKEVARQALIAYLTRPEIFEQLGLWVGGDPAGKWAQKLDAFAEARRAALAAKEEIIQTTAQAAGSLDPKTLRPIWQAAWNGAYRLRPAGEDLLSAPTASRPLAADQPFAYYGDALTPWLKAGPSTAPSQWLLDTPVADVAQPVLANWYRCQVAAADALDEMRELLTAAQEFKRPEDINDLLLGLWQAGDDQPLADWQTEIVPYEGSETRTFILPFAGHYYLAYLVEFLSPHRDDGWRVFVDAEEDNHILGRPERLQLHTLEYYENSAAVLGPSLTPLTPAAVAIAVNDLKAVNTTLTGATGYPADLDALIALPGNASLTTSQQEALNVVYHAWQTVRRFIDVGKLALPPQVPVGNPAPGLRLNVGIKDRELNMGFLPSVVDIQGTITFQTDPGSGLEAEGGRVFTPSLDPEVVVHELTHGLMWLLDRAPFDNRYDDVPFSRALLEGYATYLAHSLLESDPVQTAWARAAYRDGNAVGHWGQRWSLGIAANAPADVTPNKKHGGLAGCATPNCYPEEETSGLPVYDVGMIWARALWDVRTMLKTAQTNNEITANGRDVADRLALTSYLYVHGWSVNFEMAAEGLIDAARTVLKDEFAIAESMVTTLVGRMINLFAARGILAERGMQTIAQVPGAGPAPQWAIGADTGLRFTADLTKPWPAGWTEVQLNARPLPGVVALAQDSSTNITYIATENGIYTWNNATDNLVAPHTGTDQTAYNNLLSEGVLSLGMIAGTLYAGTRRSIWRHMGSTWQNWRDPALDLYTPILGIAEIHPANNPVTICLVRTLRELTWSIIQPAVPSWRNIRLVLGNNTPLDWLTALHLVGTGKLYVGTLHQGVRPITIGNYVSSPNPRLEGTPEIAIRKNELGDHRALCLASAGLNRLFAGTTDGLFQCDLNSITGWTRVPASPTGVIVTAIAVAGHTLVAGTAADGFWTTTI